MLQRGATIGLLGGGQLGRMLAEAAARLGFSVIVVDPNGDCPAARFSDLYIAAAYDDLDALDRLAALCDVVTFEFENIDLGALEHLSGKVPVHPDAWALRVTQDRLTEKTFLRETGIETVDFHAIDGAPQLAMALADMGGRGILKTRRFGYDGKGQIRFGGDSDPTPEEAWDAIGGAPAILEALAGFDCEISVIVTRGRNGETHEFEPARNDHEGGILARSTVPCGLDSIVMADAMEKTRALASRLRYVGTLALEFFVMEDGRLIGNEIAPRVHNSGHWTEAACSVSQFEQHIRAISGWPLAESYRHSDCVMTNLIGDEIGALPGWAADGAVRVHDYGKRETRPGRKMGHVTRLVPR
ncbi:5-(carboxyamino)imidazole ribonucleotide synthase [Oceaniradius stylonematis]|uniref:5-(carboxyamino)imidazole ribonucleotide synthase n=1 Tax=Oceaniradius stylonematis TaxID=2184161 RepID=UPI003C7BF0C0